MSTQPEDTLHSYPHAVVDEDGSLIRRVSDDFIDDLIQLLDHHRVKRIRTMVAPLHGADMADLLEALSPTYRVQLVAVLKNSLDPQILLHLEEPILEEVLEVVGVRYLSRALKDLNSDDALVILEALPASAQARLLEVMPPLPRASIEQSLSFPEESAGRLMQQRVVTALPTWTVKRTLDHIKKASDLPDVFFNVYVVSTQNKLIGSIPLPKLLKVRGNVELRNLVEEDTKVIPVATPKKEVALFFNHYGLVAAPVVDDHQYLLGDITADDVLEVIEEETEREMLNIAGVADSDFFSPWFETFYRRLGWLIIGFFNALLAVFVIDQFEESLKKMVVLAVLMPIIATMSANAGAQVLSVAVRALGICALKQSNAARAVAKEAFVGVLNGILFGAGLIGLAMGFYHDVSLGIVLAVAMLLSMLWAAFAGVVIPLLLERFDFDPAIGSGPLLLASTDVVGYILFLGLATWLLI